MSSLNVRSQVVIEIFGTYNIKTTNLNDFEKCLRLSLERLSSLRRSFTTKAPTIPY
ncbi:hypothetical protein RO3G_16352 [Rhizopus delemar RA 99-880]|uniref:Uncharacterized protein n=1 Tax=Rhizopus delemar (strain RA 99-880 / ATCC MYA-4621 / FGSC 9543 / NRRL 43880) TaxID=246409 RepID=I1CT61_RHIO9|nr:hypothetical protein RO3G_16352 [Rhizopus delemar RA 99-880]|eukprot:EIE91641.1 hypothetical protein RO3G_16352 [Rhizopus delemar RA 99-880]